MSDPLDDPDVTAALKIIAGARKPEMCRRCARDPIRRGDPADGLCSSCATRTRELELEQKRAWHARGRAKNAGALAGAVTWLRHALRKGPRDARQLYARAYADGISERTLRRAAREADIVRTREGSSRDGTHRSMWALPERDGAVTPAKRRTVGRSNGR